jgi:hypothetical protein
LYNWEQTWLLSIDGLGVQADEDWYRIDVGPSGYEHVQVDVRFTDADGDINVCLVNESGVQLACSTSATDDEFIDHEVPGPGTYYIRVYGQDAGNPYDLWWDDRQEDDAYEENDTLATAWHPGTNWENTWLFDLGGLGIQADEDWYRIDVGSDHVQVDVQFTDADGDIDVCLVDESGGQLACSVSTTDNEFIDHVVPGPGTYYIRVYFDDAGNTYDLWWDDLCLMSFSDVSYEYWAWSYIRPIACAGITTGYGDGTYRPLNVVNRAQMAIFIIRALYGDDFSYGSTPYFPDVLDTTPWAFKYIQKMYEEGISTGYGDGTYRPLTQVNRAQMAIFIIRALYGDDFSYGSTPYFPDVPSEHWAFKYVQKMHEEGISTGYGDGTYRPLTQVNRAQMAVFIARAFLGLP